MLDRFLILDDNLCKKWADQDDFQAQNGRGTFPKLFEGSQMLDQAGIEG
jgi:hypothetical protein